MNRFKKAFLAVVSMTLFQGIPSIAAAQQAPGWSDSLCIHFTGDSRSILVELRSDIIISGTVPLMVCSLRKGATYDFTVRGTGLEIRTGVLAVGDDGGFKMGGKRLGTFARNILPGWGSLDEGRKNEGLTDLGSLAATGMILYQEHMEYRHIENRLAILNSLLDGTMDAENRAEIRIEANRASRDLNVQNDYRRRLVGYAAYLYGFQLIDPWLVGPPPRAEFAGDGGVIEIRSSRSNRWKAAFLSLLRPGRGQFYQEKKSRGVFFSLASTAGVLVALDFLNQYEEAVNDYEINLDYFENAVTIAEKQYYLQKSDEYWDDVEKTREWRNISYGVAAGIWAAGVIDALIPGNDDGPLSVLSLDTGPTHAALVYRF